MAPSPTPLPNGIPQWVGPLLVGVAVVMITGSMQSIGSKIDNQTVQLAETKKVLEMLCTFMEEQKPVDRAQDERLRQLELRVQALGR
jgi:hypothetical protein